MEMRNSRLNTAKYAEVQTNLRKDGPWNRRTKCEKRIIFFLVTCLLTIIGIVTAVVLARKESDDNTPGARLLENMDMSVDPCEDFYMYACGAWKTKHVIPEDMWHYSVFDEVNDGVKLAIKSLLEDTASYPNASDFSKAKDMYASCIDSKNTKENNYTVDIPLLNELGGWPALGSIPGGSWSSSKFNLSRILTSLRKHTKYDKSPLINLHCCTKEKDSKRNIKSLDQPEFGLPGRLYYLQDSLSYMREVYVSLAVAVAKLFGADEEVADREMRQVLELEIDIANISMKSEDRRDNEALYNKMTILELKHNFTEPGPTDPIQFDWLEYIAGVYEGVHEWTPIIVKAVPYFEKLFNVLQKHGKRVVANYVVWYAIMNRDRELDSWFSNLLADYNKQIHVDPIDEKAYLSETVVGGNCIIKKQLTAKTIIDVIGDMYVNQTFNESSKTSVLDMIGNIKDAFDELLDELDWIDDPTKELVREKAKAMKESVGYPDDVIDAEIINEIYTKDPIEKNKYLKNVLNNLKGAELDGLHYHPFTVGAFYYPLENKIVIPAGILQPPFYSGSQPESMNYGAIGHAIGHEITHGFDDEGRQYDKDGNLKTWWNASIITNFKEKAQCIVDQYSQFVVPEVNLRVNGINTQGENIADNGGLKQSFRAYRKWIEKRGSEEPVLSELKFTNNQLFFIAFAQTECTNVREEGMIYMINNGVHSPGRFRVIGTLQNSRDFSAAFGCKKNSYMNPEKKCYVW